VSSWWVEALVATMRGTIADKDACVGAKIKFMLVIGPEMRPTSTTKHSHKVVVRSKVEQFLKRGCIFKDRCRESINEITYYLKSLGPISKWS
jgi:hypothetical protein